MNNLSRTGWLRRGLRACAALLYGPLTACLLSLAFAPQASAQALTPEVSSGRLTPESPEVRRVIDRGIQFLSRSGGENRPGALALVGIALLKDDAPADHPVVQKAVGSIRQMIAANRTPTEIYTLGLSIIFMVTLDPVQHRAEINSLLGMLAKAQKEHGGWGYSGRATGDTSMTQYAVLGMWEAAQADFQIPLKSWTGVTNWLLRTQAPDGAFGYQGVDPGSFRRVPQQEVRHSMATAGSGSLYICSEQLGLLRFHQYESDVPTALQPVVEHPPAAGVDASYLAEARDLGDRWMDNHFQIEVVEWNSYYLYSYERYQSFREGTSRRRPPASDWYDECARFLIELQGDDGSWFDGTAGPVPDTAFAVLFLLRSTRKSIERAKLGGGTLVGGRGISGLAGDRPAAGRPPSVRRLEGPAQELFAAMENPRHEDHLRALAALAESIDRDDDTLLNESERLRRLALEGPPEARLAAVRVLARTRNLDAVDVLIEALGDPDVEIVRVARDGLRFASRKPAGFGLPAHPTEAERLTAVRQWRAWYASVRPSQAPRD